MTTQAVIFDVDGTLIDSVTLHAEAWKQTLAHYGVHVSLTLMRQQIGQGGDKILPAVAPDLPTAKYPEIDAFRSTLFKEHFLRDVRPLASVRPLFDKLTASGVRIALGSSGKAEELQAYKRIAEIDDIDLVEATSSDADHSKPDPDIFTAVANKLNLPAKVCVVVGDSPYDMASAQRAGMRGVGVLTGGFGDQTLRQAGACRVYSDLTQLLSQFCAAGVAAFQEG